VKTLLITTVGGRVGHGILDVMAPWRDRVRVVGVNSVADASANFRCDVVHLAPGTADLAAWMERMRAILRAERPDVVLAGRDGDLRPLAALKGEPEFAATCFLCPGPEAARIVTDKYETFTFARAHGLPFIDTAADRDGVERLIAAHGFPLIVKPRTGTGAHGVRALASRDEVAAWLARGGVVFQPFIDPPGSLDRGALDPRLGVPMVFAVDWRVYYTVHVTVHPDRSASYEGTTLITFHGADTTYSARADEAGHEAAALGFARALGALDFVGALNLQGRRDGDGRFVPFELNGRITGGVTAHEMLGVEETRVALDILVGPRPPVASVESVRAAATWRTVRWDRVDRREIAALDREGVWRAPGGPGRG